jgi:hypothetical protein
LFGPGVGILGYKLICLVSLPIVALGAFLSAELLLILVIYLCSEYLSGPAPRDVIVILPRFLFEFPIVAFGSYFKC